jgi:hypothetical protein
VICRSATFIRLCQGNCRIPDLFHLPMAVRLICLLIMLYFAPDHASAAELRGLICLARESQLKCHRASQKVADSAGAFATLCRCRVKDYTEKDTHDP